MKKRKKGVTLLSAGEMGIGNTSPSSAIAAVLTGASVDEVTGIGSGIPSERVRHKAGLIRRGIAINRPNPSDAVDVLAKVGGPELAAMSGLMLGGRRCAFRSWWTASSPEQLRPLPSASGPACATCLWVRIRPLNRATASS